MARRRRAACVGLVALLATSLASCSLAPGAAGHGEPPAGWTSFGPFQKPAKFAAGYDFRGPGEIRLPGGIIATLDAETLLGSEVKLPARSDYTVHSEHYTYSYDGGTPVLVGLIETARTMHYRGYSEEEFVTFVMGVSAEAKPRELARARIFRGGAHESSFAGRSDDGVVAVLLQGKLNTDDTEDSRVVGVDAVRGTEVWVKEHGFPVFGDDTAWFYLAPTPASCASAVMQYRVASGIVISQQDFAQASPDSGGTCKTADAANGR